MHVRQLVQFAAFVASVSDRLIHSQTPFPSVALERYWTLCRSRHDEWSRQIREFTVERQDLAGSGEATSWLQPTLMEVLSAEVVTRIWAAICDLADQERQVREAGPIAHNVLLGQIEARHRVLNLMVYGYGLRVEEAVALNRLRIRNERWTDTLLAFIGPEAARPDWAFEPARVKRLATRLAPHQVVGCVDPGMALLLATITSANYSAATGGGPNDELNRRIACSILACFPTTLFDGTGQLVSRRQLELTRCVADSRGNLRRQQPAEVESSPAPNMPPTDEGPRRRF